jgi:hypothetical protein
VGRIHRKRYGRVATDVYEGIVTSRYVPPVPPLTHDSTLEGKKERRKEGKKERRKEGRRKKEFREEQEKSDEGGRRMKEV